MDEVLVDLPLHQLADHGFGRGRDLVEAVQPVHRHQVLRSQALQHADLDAHQVRMENAHRLVLRARRVGERAEDVEEGAHAELLAHRRGVLHRRVMRGREHEAEAELVDRLPGLLRRERNAGAERFQHVGAARGRRHRAPHVLGHPGTRRGGDESRAGRDVEGMRRVATGAAGIDEMRIVLHLDVGRQLAHHLRRGGDLPDRFLLHAQPDDEPRDLRRSELAAHDLAHHVEHLVVEHLAVLDRALDRLGNRDLFHACLPSMKFCSILWPCSVSSASGWNCTPSTARLRWRRPMISPSSDSAVTARQAGNDDLSTTSEWYLVALKSGGMLEKMPFASWRMRETLPCITCLARTTLPPKACPIAWWPRHTPSRGIRPITFSISCKEMPASLGVQGPGEMTMWKGACASISSMPFSSFL